MLKAPNNWPYTLRQYRTINALWEPIRRPACKGFGGQRAWGCWEGLGPRVCAVPRAGWQQPAASSRQTKPQPHRHGSAWAGVLPWDHQSLGGETESRQHGQSPRRVGGSVLTSQVYAEVTWQAASRCWTPRPAFHPTPPKFQLLTATCAF